MTGMEANIASMDVLALLVVIGICDAGASPLPVKKFSDFDRPPVISFEVDIEISSDDNEGTTTLFKYTCQSFNDRPR